MDCRICALSVLTFIAIEIYCASSEPTKREDDPVSLESNPNFLQEALLSNLGEDDYEKRRSLMRFGKRRSLMRFGKRGSILRFGKRSSLMRFGKRNFYDDDDAYVPDEFYDSNELTNDKRGSLMRFGKKSSIMRFGRSTEKKPHVPWRFGKDLESWDYNLQ